MHLTDLSASDRKTVLLLCMVLFTSGADMLIMTPILPVVSGELGVSVDLGGLWVTSYAGATGLFALIFGPVSDYWGRRPMLRSGMTVLALGTLACGFATDFWTMLAARSFAGVGAGMLVTSTTSFAGDHFSAKQRAVAVGWVMSGFFLSLILSVPLGASLAAAVGWPMMFRIYAGFAGVVLIALLVALPDPRHEQRAEHLSLTTALSGYRTLLQNKKALGIFAMSVAIGTSMTMFSVYSSPWMEEEFGLGTTARGLVYAVGGPAVILGSPLAGKLSNRFGRVRVILAGSLLMALTQAIMPFTLNLARYVDAYLSPSPEMLHVGYFVWPATVLPMAVFFFVMLAGSSRSAPFQTLALEVVPSDRRGALAAIRNTFNQVGSAVGAALGGLIWSVSPHRYLAVCWTAALVTVLGMTALRALVGLDRPPRLASRG